MTLPQCEALFKFWAKWPPTHVAVSLAWLERKDDSSEKEPSDKMPESPDMSAFMGMPHVAGNWVGGPPVRPADVIALAEKAKKNG